MDDKELFGNSEQLNDTISRQAAIDVADAVWSVTGDKNVAKVWDQIKDLPSVTPERKCGKWNAYYHGINETPSFTYSCNQCGYSAPYGLYGGKYSQKKWNYCPSCGADMRGEQDGGGNNG